MDPNHDDSETRVACEGFSGTTEGLRVQTLGDDESGAEDGEETEDDD
jgi:hypothetical protein